MSRIGNKTILVPQGVTVSVSPENYVVVKGPHGELTKQFSPILKITQTEQEIQITRPNDEKTTKQLHGTARALLANMVQGVHQPFQKELDIIGVGYKANSVNGKLTLALGFSHPVEIEVPKGLVCETPSPVKIIIKGIDKELVGEFAARVRLLKKPEPYKGKGIRYTGEHVRQKAGKTAK